MIGRKVTPWSFFLFLSLFFSVLAFSDCVEKDDELKKQKKKNNLKK